MSRSQKPRRRRSRSPVRTRSFTRSHSQLDALAREAGPSNASGSGTVLTGIPPAYPPQPGPSSFQSYEHPGIATSSRATLSETTLHSSSYNEAGPSGSNVSPAVHTRAREKAAQSASLPKLKRQLSDEIRQRKAEKSQRKRDRDLESRIRLNNAMPEDRRCASNSPGQVELNTRLEEYIPEVRNQVRVLQQEVEDLRRAARLQSTTRDVVSTLLTAHDAETEEGNAASARAILLLEQEVERLRARLAEQ
ncbi:hypothetical protein DENSPDRAFT_297183 [Dentipellis sp. KUC8613]|nr:hypothetical protein DENSPDRAFT_297183 [Dentipellis sp. KUC8613]